MKTPIMRSFSLYLILIMLVGILLGCDDLSEDNSSGTTICDAPYTIQTHNINEFVDYWYKVQKGDILDVEGIPQTNEEYVNRQLIEHLSPFKTLIYPIIKNDSYVLNDAGTYHDPKIMCYYYIEKRENSTSNVNIIIHIYSQEFTSYEQAVKDYDISSVDGKAFYEKDNAWFVDWGDWYMYICFPFDIDASDANIIYEYFDFNSINIAEYESMMQ